MSNPELSTILIIGLSGAGLKTFHLLIDKLYPTCGNLIKTRSIRIIAIEKSTFAYWPPGSLRASVEPEFENQIFSNFDHIIPKRIINDPVAKDLVKVITGVEVLELDLDQKQAKVNQSLEPHGIHTGVILSFDYLVMATGSSYAFPCRPPTEGQDPDQAKSELKALQTDIESSKSILIAGSGAVGLEFAGEVSYRYASPSTRKQIIIVSSTPAILMDHSKALAKSIESQLVARGVEMIYNYKVDLTSAGIHKTSKLDSLTSINLISNEDQSIKPIEADFVFLAIGNKPNSSLVPAEYLNPKTKRVKVNKSLQVLNKDSSDPLPGIYALGDVSDFEESKLYAALDGQASTVSKNLLADLTKPESAPKTIHKPIHGTIAIPLGAYGGASEIMGYTLGLGPLATSLAKGRGLFVWMFRSMYPDKSK